MAVVVANLILFSAPANALFGRDVPVSLDVDAPPGSNMQFAAKPYMVSMRQRIQESWRPNLLSPAFKVKVQFQLNSEGQIGEPRLIQSSGNEIFDKRCVSAIKICAPFPPVPVELLNITATFDNRYMSMAELTQNMNRYQMLKQQYLAQQQQQQQYQQQYQQQPQYQYQQQYQPALIQPQDRNIQTSNLKERVDLNQSPLEQSSQIASGEERIRRQPDSIGTENQSINSWDHPQTKSEIASMSPEAIEDYKRWFQNEWLNAPAERRFYFLNNIKFAPQSVVKRKPTVIKGKPAK